MPRVRLTGRWSEDIAGPSPRSSARCQSPASPIAAPGVGCAKRQVEALAVRSTVDFEAFYESTPRTEVDDSDILVLSADGKGIVMRPDALRPQTAKAAGRASTKLKTRLSKGEKRNRKRMAEVGAVYDVTPVGRAPADIICRDDGGAEKPPAPKARNKWLTASVVDDAAVVISEVFDQAERRDPAHRRPWVALVDGAKHQIDRIKAEAKARDVKVAIVCDFVHVMEYLWSAAWSFFAEGDPAAEEWVADKALGVLPLGTDRSRGHLEAPSPTQQRRLRPLLEVSPRPGAPASTRSSLRRRSHPPGYLTSLYRSNTQTVSRQGTPGQRRYPAQPGGWAGIATMRAAMGLAEEPPTVG